MIDLHCHILPGVDDGAPDLRRSVEMARAAAEAGTHTIAATPHVRDDHPFDLRTLPDRVERLRAALREAEVDVRIEVGGEADIQKAVTLPDDALRGICLGGGPYLLVESPYRHAVGWLEEALEDLTRRGFRLLLAHPERCPSFLSDRARLEALVEAGALCSVTAASMTGRFGSKVQGFTAELFETGLVHDVASDAHDVRGRGLGLLEGFEVLGRQLRGLTEQAAWFAEAMPAAILAGTELPGRPPPPKRVRGLRRLLGQRG